MSSTIATLAGNTGLGSERQIVWAVNSANYWAFGYTGTSTLSTWYSSDGISWTAGGTHTLSNAHNSEGRNLAVAYKNVGGVDVVHISIPWSSAGSIAVNAIRATISGTTITFHSSETAVASGTTDGGSLLWAGSGLEFDSNNKLHLANGFAGGGNGDINSSDSSADAGTAEQMTPVTWTAHVIDSSVANETRSAYVVDLGSGNAGLIADNGSGHSNTTGLDWHKWNGSSWNVDNTNGKVTGGTITAIDKNDWGAVAVSSTDVHAVYRDASGDLVHRRFDGTNWNAGQSIPAQNSLAGGGIALTSDGASVWLCVIDTDAANTIRYIRWSSLATNGLADTWDTNWQAAETSSQTRTWIGCTRDVQSQTGLVYWSEGNSFVVSTFQALPPADPVGAWLQSNQGSTGTAATTFAVTFTTQNIVAGNRIIVAIAAWNATATTVTSVTDSAGNQYAKDKDAVESDNTHISIWSAPITAGGGTKPTVTAHASASTNEWAMWVHEYSGLLGGTAGYLDGTNSHVVSASTSPFTSGASTPVPGAANEIAFGFYGDGGNNVTTIGVSAGWTQRGTSIQGTSSTAEGACEDQVTVAGTGSNASFTLSNTGSPAGALVAVYKLAISAIGLPATDPTGLSPLTLPGSPYAQMLWAQPLITAPPFVFVSVQQAVQKRRTPPQRSRWITPQVSATVAGTPPIVVIAVQKRPRTKPAPDKWLIAPIFNSGGLTPLTIQAHQKPKPIQLKPKVQPGLLANQPIVQRATQKKLPTRGVSGVGSTAQAPHWIQAPQFNSGGISAVLTQGAKRKNLTRSVSSLAGQPQSPQWLVAPKFNSGGIPAQTFKAVQKSRPFRGNSSPNESSPLGNPRWIEPPIYNSGGIRPLTTRSVQKAKPIRSISKVIVSTPTVQQVGTPPLTFKAVQKSKPIRSNSRVQAAPIFNSGGIQPQTFRAVQKSKPIRANSRVQTAPKFNSGSIQPLTFKAVQKVRPLRPASRLAGTVAQYNSGGIVPIVLAAPRRPPTKRILSRLLIPTQTYVPVFIRPNPLAFPLRAQAIAGIGAGVVNTVYGQGIYGISVYGQTLVSVLAVPLQAQAGASPTGSGKGSALAFPLQSNPTGNRIV